jgi:DNA-binding beta-propeller fold protein YncE
LTLQGSLQRALQSQGLRRSRVASQGKRKRGIHSPRPLLHILILILACNASLILAGCDQPNITGRRPQKIFGERGLGPGQFVYPRAIAVAPDGAVFVVDKMARIQRFNPDGEFETSWQMPLWQAGKPTGITVDNQNRVMVADTHYHQVMVFDRDGKELFRFGSQGEGNGQFIYPTCVAVGPDNQYYVSEYGGNDRISRFSPNRQYLGSFGDKNAGPAELSRPQAMIFDTDGTLLVADACHHRICRFSPTGELISSFGTAGRESGQLQYPYDIALCPDGSILVCEFGNNRVQRFDNQGKCLGIWGSTGRDPGQLAYPWGVAVGKDNRIYVLDSGNNRVQMFKM